MFSPAPNQIWKENGASGRYIRLIDVQSSYIQLRTCDEHGNFMKGSRVARVNPDCFDGRSGGYIFIKQTP